jgi:hypothetical protein
MNEMPSEQLSKLKINLGEAAEDKWLSRYCVKSIYFNDIACGVLLAIKSDKQTQERSEEPLEKKIARGLRVILQQLWASNLARPLVAVYYMETNSDQDSVLDPISWDQEWHRGDFVLRKAPNELEAYRLLETLLMDRIEGLEEEDLAVKIGHEDIETILRKRQRYLATLESSEAKIELDLVKRMLNEMKKNKKVPDLAEVVIDWAREIETQAKRHQ